MWARGPGGWAVSGGRGVWGLTCPLRAFGPPPPKGEEGFGANLLPPPGADDLAKRGQVGASDRLYNTEQFVIWLNASSAAVPTTLVPNRSSSGDHTAIVALPGTTETMPPPTPLLDGKPTR